MISTLMGIAGQILRLVGIAMADEPDLDTVEDEKEVARMRAKLTAYGRNFAELEALRKTGTKL